MMIETIKIAHPEIEGEYMVINAADFNLNLHRLFTEPEPESPDTEAAKKAKGKKKPPTPNAALLAEIRPDTMDESGDLDLDETTAD